MIRSEKYNVFVDCGAYIGLFSQIAAHHCRDVVAYEAHPFYFGILLYNMKFFGNVDCKYKFLGGPIEIPKINHDLKSPRINPNLKELIPLHGDKLYKIETATLDDESAWGIPSTTLIKLDVEGHEIDVLEGSTRLLQKPYIHWIIDIHNQYGIDPKEVSEFFPERKLTWISPKVLKVEGLK
jgi:FkbM family methyltransferase